MLRRYFHFQPPQAAVFRDRALKLQYAAGEHRAAFSSWNGGNPLQSLVQKITENVENVSHSLKFADNSVVLRAFWTLRGHLWNSENSFKNVLRKLQVFKSTEVGIEEEVSYSKKSLADKVKLVQTWIHFCLHHFVMSCCICGCQKESLHSSDWILTWC